MVETTVIVGLTTSVPVTVNDGPAALLGPSAESGRNTPEGLRMPSTPFAADCAWSGRDCRKEQQSGQSGYRELLARREEGVEVEEQPLDGVLDRCSTR